MFSRFDHFDMCKLISFQKQLLCLFSWVNSLCVSYNQSLVTIGTGVDGEVPGSHGILAVNFLPGRNLAIMQCTLDGIVFHTASIKGIVVLVGMSMLILFSHTYLCSVFI